MDRLYLPGKFMKNTYYLKYHNEVGISLSALKSVVKHKL